MNVKLGTWHFYSGISQDGDPESGSSFDVYAMISVNIDDTSGAIFYVNIVSTDRLHAYLDMGFAEIGIMILQKWDWDTIDANINSLLSAASQCDSSGSAIQYLSRFLKYSDEY